LPRDPSRLAYPTGFIASPGGATLFSAYDPEHGLELWQTDGTSEGTRLFQDIAPGMGSSSPKTFTVSGSRLFFIADDNRHGNELWVIGGPDWSVAQSTTITASANGTVSGTLPTAGIDGANLTFSVVTNGKQGTATITNAATGAFTYTANAGATGSDSFTFKVSDGQRESNIATVTVNLTGGRVFLPLAVR
jgi:ELWxxDGT repeat protein